MAKYLSLMVLAAGMGIPAAFFTIALPGMMRDGGASLMETGLVYLVWLPSVAKVLWASRVEALAGRVKTRRVAIGILPVVIGLCFLPVGWLAAGMVSGPLLALAVVSASVGLTLHLVLAGWCMTFLEETDRSLANGFLAAGMVLGGVLGGGATPTLAAEFGWQPVIWSLSMLIAVTGFAGFLLHGDRGGEAVEVARLKDAIKVFSREKGWVLFLMTILIASTGSVDMTLAVRLVDAGYSPERAAFILGTFATLLMVPTTLFIGYAGRRWNAALLFSVVCVFKGGILSCLAILGPENAQLIASLAVGEFICAGALTVLTWQFYMSCSADRAPVSGFAMMTSTDALFRMVLGIAVGTFGMLAGMAGLFGFVAALNLVAAIFILLTWPSHVVNTTLRNA